VKNSFDKLRVILFSFHVDARLRRSPLKTSPHNQQMLLGKWGGPDFEEQAHWTNEMSKGSIGELTRKSLLQEKK